MLTKIRYGIIGLNYGRDVLIPATLFTEKFELRAVAGLNPRDEELEIQGEKFVRLKPDDLITAKDIELVLIACPPEYHIKYITLGIQNAKNIYCEKPVGLSVKELQTLKKKLLESKLQLFVGYQFRFDPMIEAVSKIIEDTSLIKHVNLKIEWKSRGGNRYKGATPPLSKQVLFDFGCHIIDYCNYLIKSRDETFTEIRSLESDCKDHAPNELLCGRWFLRSKTFIIEFAICRLSSSKPKHEILVTTSDATFLVSQAYPFQMKDLKIVTGTKSFDNDLHKVLLNTQLNTDLRTYASRQLFFAIAKNLGEKLADSRIATIEDAIMVMKIVDRLLHES